MEVWRGVIDAKGRGLWQYEVSDRGRVRSYLAIGHGDTLKKPRPKATFLDKAGFANVTLRLPSGTCYVYLVHQLVALAFLGRRPSKRHVAVHKNDNRQDNRARNLAWVTRSEASRLSMKRRPRRGPAKLTVVDARRILASRETVKVLAARYKVTLQTIYGIRKRKTWRDLR